MAVIAYTDRGGLRSYVVKDVGGSALSFSEHISDAARNMPSANP